MNERRPASLLPPAIARLAVYVVLAGIGALQWARQVDHASTARTLVWVASGALAGAAVALAGRTRGAARLVLTSTAAAGGLLVAVAACGLDLTYWQPARWDDLGDGLLRGAQALNSVHLPYIGKDPWVLATIELSGALLCASAAILAAWPGARSATRMLSLALLLILAASPIVSMGVPHPVPIGLALAFLTAAFFWLERIPGRPGVGLAILAAAAMLAAVPLGAAADREQPWFDYKAFAEGLGGGDPISFDWDHGYGPIDWPREGVELFRVHQPGRTMPLYWKADVLNDFDGRQWSATSRTDPGVDTPVEDLPANWRDHPGYDHEFTVSLSRLRTESVVGAGTVLAVRDSTEPVEPAFSPGLWITQGARVLSRGDSYTVRAHVPRPSPIQLAAATVGKDTRRHGLLTMRAEFRPEAMQRVPRTPPAPFRPNGRPVRRAEISFPPFEVDGDPEASYTAIGTVGGGDEALANSYYDRTWALAKALRERATSPYDYLLRVNAYLRDPRFVYTEVPPDPGAEAPLEFFLFDSRAGYCQQYSGAMALLLRMGGIPARVVSGFSPGGLRRSSGEWIVRDTDAHSWVEAWFDGLGWVTFDPTPPGTPARSQVAAIAPPRVQATPTPTPTADGAATRRPEGLRREQAPAATGGGGEGEQAGGSIEWRAAAGGALLLAIVLAMAVAVRRRRAPAALPADRALAELERALRRSGRGETPMGTTLAQLERRLGVSSDGASYLRALQVARYGPGGRPPSRAQRSAFRRELAAGLGWTGRLRALWALPPSPWGPRRPAP